MRDTAGGPRALLVGACVRHGLALGTLVTAALLLFAEPIFLDRGFFYRDLYLQWHPQAEAFVRSVASGSWPVWNPYVSFGRPLLANPNSQALYPWTWLHLLLTPWRSYTLYVVTHFVLGGLGVYALLLRVGVRRSGSVVGGLVFVLSGPFLSLVDLWNHLAGAAWMPWILAAGARAIDERRAVPCLALGLALAMPVFAGSPEMALMGGTVVGVLGLEALLRDRTDLRGALRLTGMAALAVTMAVAISAVQWLPSLEMARASLRQDLPDAMRSFWSLHPITTLQAFWPVFLDRLPLHGGLRATLFESREPFLASLYLGLATLPLVLGALLGPQRPWRRLLAFTAAAAWIVALGRHTPLYDALTALLPPARAVRFPAKAFVLTGLCWACLAGMGFEAWQRGPRRRRATAVASGIVLGAVGAATGLTVLAHLGAEAWGSALILRLGTRRTYHEILAPIGWSVGTAAACAGLGLVVLRLRRRWPGPRVAAALATLAVLDLVAAHRLLNPTAPADLFTYRPPVLSSLETRSGQRVYVVDYDLPGRARHLLGHPQAFLTQVPQEDWPAPWFEALAVRTYPGPSVLGTWGIEGAFGFDTLALYPPHLRQLGQMLLLAERGPAELRLLRMGAVSRVVSLHSTGFESLAPIARLPSPFIEPILVYGVPEPLPRAYAVGTARVGDGAEAWRIIQDPAFDPAREVILAGGPAYPPRPDFRGSVRVVSWKPDRARIVVELSHPGWLVLVDSYDPGWRVAVDGAPQALLRANVAFRAIAVPAGTHDVALRYWPPALSLGLVISGVTALFALAAIALQARRGAAS